MSSPLQIEANRRNSQKSTGPRTVAGKAASTLNLNSLKSGIYAEAEIIADESAADLQALVAAYTARFHPGAPEESCLVDTLVHSEWTLRRLRRAEAQLWARNIETSESSFDENTLELGRALCYSESRVFARLQIRINATLRNYRHARGQTSLSQGAALAPRGQSGLSPRLHNAPPPPSPSLASPRPHRSPRPPLLH